MGWDGAGAGCICGGSETRSPDEAFWYSAYTDSFERRDFGAPGTKEVGTKSDMRTRARKESSDSLGVVEFGFIDRLPLLGAGEGVGDGGGPSDWADGGRAKCWRFPLGCLERTSAGCSRGSPSKRRTCCLMRSSIVESCRSEKCQYADSTTYRSRARNSSPPSSSRGIPK